MGSSYTDKYKILKTFKKDTLQNVLIGSNKENDSNVVVINILYKDKTFEVLSKLQLSKGLHNLVHLEENQNSLIVITEYKEGTPLDVYLSYFDTTLKHKINLAYEYMTKIVRYDIFHNSVKKVLIDESQINIKNGELHFSELLFLNDDFSDPISFNIIASKIASIIEKIVFTKTNTQDIYYQSEAKKITEFINRLRKDANNFNSIEEVYDAFRKIYIYNFFMDEEYKLDNKDKEALHLNEKNNNLPHNKIIGFNEMDNLKNNSKKLDVDKSIKAGLAMSSNNRIMNSNEILIGNEENAFDYENPNEYKRKSRNYMPIVVIGGILVVILLFSILYKPVLNFLNLSTTSSHTKTEAYFEYSKISSNTYYFENKSKIFGKDNDTTQISWQIYKRDKLVEEINDEPSLKIRFENQGEYRIVLTITDKYGNTDNYDEIIYNNTMEIDELKNKIESEEKLNNLSLVYSNESIVKDYNAYRSGDHSLKLGKKGKFNSQKIIIDKINITDVPSLSMWIAPSSKENIKILVRGFKNNKSQFLKHVTFSPKEINTWELVEISGLSENIDKIEITFKNFNSPIWLDDIIIGSYK
ncbi:hypothetical protein [Paramaledivibacter caminithermalis]|jgi:hypothetical protein|uniref:Uncharacterized protein n=1 Tax=Paramaledivibacter caminithermalis (strain DSM 15212 / CIP 107654 / DViRD3) TaxID=1121301 RepID=A0A1M6LH53_PARC5|nr:hypothetical protein [Paramaledivibacter caminithermalis]SHJ70509.1 hypothetical protein SAMN02745912_00794 [Paramaledivibacter caminithermalis DSM 15212]